MRWLLLFCALVLSSCSSTSRRTSRTAPDEGLILYRERTSQPGEANRQTRPATHVFTTAAGELAEESTFRVHKGTIGRRASEKEVERAIQRLFRSRRTDSTRVLPPEKFKDLWSRIESTGILELPLYRAAEVPDEGPYFLLESGSKRWVIQRPDSRTGLPAQTWDQAKLQFFAFMNER